MKSLLCAPGMLHRYGGLVESWQWVKVTSAATTARLEFREPAIRGGRQRCDAGIRTFPYVTFSDLGAPGHDPCAY